MRTLMDLARQAGWLASLAYAAGFKRVGRIYFADVVLALTEERNAVVVMSGPLPGSHQRQH